MYQENHLGWRITRWALFTLMKHAAHRVLLRRTIQLKDGTELRWFKPDVKRFLAGIEDEVITLRPAARLSELPNTGNRLMVELAVYTIASYRAMLRLNIEVMAAKRLTADIGWDIYAFMLRLSSLPFGIITRNPGKRLRWTIRLLLHFPFNAPGAPGYAVTAWNDDDAIHTHWTHCPPQTFVRNLISETGDCGDLDAFYRSWCLYDWPGADLIAGDRRRGHYHRSQTLSRGDPVCDMCWAGRASGGAGHGTRSMKEARR